MNLDLSWWLLNIAVLAASLLQAATGIGFGVIAGPILLLALDSGAAIQVSIALSFAIALALLALLPGGHGQANILATCRRNAAWYSVRPVGFRLRYRLPLSNCLLQLLSPSWLHTRLD